MPILITGEFFITTIKFVNDYSFLHSMMKWVENHESLYSFELFLLILAGDALDGCYHGHHFSFGFKYLYVLLLYNELILVEI